MSAPDNKKIGVAIVGCGRILKKHIEAFQHQIKTTEVVAVADIDLEKAKKAGITYGVPWYRDAQEMVEKHNGQIDVIDILTPSGLHAKNLIELAHFKKHFIVEKPMALKLEDAEEMINICVKNGKRLFVVQQNRFNKPIVKLREALEQNRFGKLVMGTIRVRWCRDQSYYDRDQWRGTWSFDGGVLTNQASHHIDMLTWMMGDVESVFCYTATQLVDIETEDTAVAVLKFTNGALGVIEATTATRPKDLEGSITIMGEKGTVEIGGFAMNEIKVWNFLDANEDELKRLDEFKENPPNVYGFGHVRYLEDVANKILNNEPGGVDGLEGLKSLTLINAFYESMETGKEVFLKFTPKKAKLGYLPEELRLR